MECSHENFRKKKVDKNFLDLIFTVETQVCSDCGAFLRDNEFEIQFNGWLEEVYRSKRDKFQVQCQ